MILQKKKHTNFGDQLTWQQQEDLGIKHVSKTHL